MNLQNIHLPIMFPMEQTEITRNYGDGSSYVFRLDRETINEILMERLRREPAVITICDNISETTADYVRKALWFLDLKNSEKKKKLKPNMVLPLMVDITTIGGYVSSSFGIAERFFESGYHVIGQISEYGYSGGGLILQGCHHRVMSENAKILVHYCHSLAIESEHSMDHLRAKRRKEDYKRDNDRIINWIARRIALTNHEKHVADREKDLRKLFIKERYLYPDEALHYNLIDEILENFPQDIPPPKNAKAEVVEEKIKSKVELVPKQKTVKVLKQ